MPRLVLAIVAACVVLSLLVILRTRETEPTARPQPGSFGPRGAAAPSDKSTQFSGDSGASDFGGKHSEHGGVASSGNAKAPQLGDVGTHTVPSQEGRRLAAEPLPPPEPGSGLLNRGGDLAPIANLPEGTQLAASFKGSSATAEDGGPIIDEGVYYDSDEGAYFSPDAHLAYPDRGGVDNEKGTIAFWVQPGFNGTDVSDNSFVQLRTPDGWANRLQIFRNGPYLRFLFTDNSGMENNVGVGITYWAPGDWHHVTATWGDSVTNLYVDGALVGRGQYGGDLEVPAGTPLYVGSDLPNSTPGANSVLKSFYVLDRPLDGGEVQALYHSGP